MNQMHESHDDNKETQASPGRKWLRLAFAATGVFLLGYLWIWVPEGRIPPAGSPGPIGV